ncbi:MAG: hypothetical protein H0X40_03295 [Chthoniobacterales bacterium]|nr:hypothetical protein [Chthoniobacterales bacterium]
MEKLPNESTATVLWLLPAEPERGFLRALVARLATACAGPIFEPHLTLGFGTPSTLEKVTRAVIRLRVRGIAFRPEFTKTLFVRLENAASLRALREQLGLDLTRPYAPHLSLLYCHLPDTGKAELARGMELPFTSIAFDTVALITCPMPTESRADVESWKVVVSREIN